MKLAAVAQPPDDLRLRLLAQLGVNDLVYYDMQGMPRDRDTLRREQRRVESFGLRISVIEGGPPIDRIVLGLDGRDQQLADYVRAIDAMGQLGIGTLCYNFMPQVTADAMVLRTSRDVKERGGALTSGFRRSDFDDSHRTVHGTSTDEQMWDNLDCFLRRVIPVAEAAEVRLAMHPDDPPLSPMWGLSRIMRDVEAFERLFQMAPSDANGLTYCQGCFAELGVNHEETVRAFGSRIHFVHCRDVRGTLHDFHETFPDNGPTDLPRLFRTFREINYTGFVRSDHVPLLASETGVHDGYGFHGNIFAIGYLRGIMEPIFGKS